YRAALRPAARGTRPARPAETGGCRAPRAAGPARGRYRSRRLSAARAFPYPVARRLLPHQWFDVTLINFQMFRNVSRSPKGGNPWIISLPRGICYTESRPKRRTPRCQTGRKAVICTHLKDLFQYCKEHDVRLSSSDLVRLLCKQCGIQEVCPSGLVQEMDE